MKRHDGDYEIYCPKAFALIGDVHDTLRDRCVVVEMRRSEPARRFVYAAAKDEGAVLRERLSAALSPKADEIDATLSGFGGLPFLFDRDEEIWTPLFVLCRLLCPGRIDELERAAADMSAAKTAPARKYLELAQKEDEAQEQEYAERLLRDMAVITADRDRITTREVITKLRELPTSPWRKFGGEGLKNDRSGEMLLATLLSPFGIKPTTIRVAPKSEGICSTAKGYKRQVLLDALAAVERSDDIAHCPSSDSEQVSNASGRNMQELPPILNNAPTPVQDCGGCSDMHRGIFEVKVKNPNMTDEEIARHCGVSELIVRQASTRFAMQLRQSVGEQRQ